VAEILYDVEGHVATLTLNRPEKKNAVNHAMCQQLAGAFASIQDDPEVWCAVLTGAGGVFSSGHDLTEDFTDAWPTFADLYAIQAQLTKPLVAAVEGICYAQGTALALGCDVVLASVFATFGWPQVRRGIGSVSGPTVFARLVPRHTAMRALLTGEPVMAGTLSRLGVIEVVREGLAVLAEAQRLARVIASNAPLAVQAVKLAVVDTTPLRPLTAYRVATDILKDVLRTEDAAEGLRAFREQRPPVWKGR